MQKEEAIQKYFLGKEFILQNQKIVLKEYGITYFLTATIKILNIGSSWGAHYFDLEINTQTKLSGSNNFEFGKFEDWPYAYRDVIEEYVRMYNPYFSASFGVKKINDVVFKT